ncbi:hypothetical protein [Persicitalea jodogahamensis]|uniref:Uncharacterized protein n=1 Tax=Persicitalea jodogahamensis TaxID=402147 RepID=A0A8J3D7P9_9BACT|nr:hypothetical protein [Persicitalea jodogahamensis]GHB63920.1 hypothetical protein GCM10007390_17210 [Persicitalea jodogahamensis]
MNTTAKKIKYPTTVEDTDQMGKRYDIIQCPTCGLKQKAEILLTSPYETYLHECKGCEYIIEEDEWNSVVTI